MARADQALSVSYGARANEEALAHRGAEPRGVRGDRNSRTPIPNGEAQYSALKQRVGAALDGSRQRTEDRRHPGELAGAQTALTNAKDRHHQTNTTLQDLLQSVEGAPTEEVAAQILALQTSLQATLQTTAMLLQTNLLKYL